MTNSPFGNWRAMVGAQDADPDVRRAHEDDERRERLVERARQLDAELSVLTIYDDQRRTLGHDFGNGQRVAELIRLRRERDAAWVDARRYGYGMGLGDLNATPEQVRAAFERTSAERLQRYDRGAYRPQTANRARKAWQLVDDELRRTVEARDALGL